MSGTEQLFESDYDAYDEFDCGNNDEEENEGIVVKEKMIRRMITMLWKMAINQQEMVSGEHLILLTLFINF